MKLPKTLLAGVAGVLVMIVFVGYNAYCHWCTVGADFYKVRLIEMVQLAATVFIAVYITYMVASNIQNDQKRRDVLSDLIKKFNECLNELMDISYDYISNPDRKKERKIKGNYKQLNILLGVARKGKHFLPKDQEAIVCLDNIINLFGKLKQSVTDTPFGQEKPIYGEDKIMSIQSVYASILGKIYEYRICIYK